jgi:tetratricopeptide (TPR) repeat protein
MRLILRGLFRVSLRYVWIRSRGVTLLAVGGLIVGGCAEKRIYAPADVPAWGLVHRLRLEAPSELSDGERRSFEEGWALVKDGQLAKAASQLDGLGRRHPQIPEIYVALGFLELKAGNPQAGERYFENSLAARPDLAAASTGYFLAAIVAGNQEAALSRLQRVRPEETRSVLKSRYEATLRLNVAETRLTTARGLMGESRYQEAAAAFLDVLDLASEAAGLYVETTEAELAAGLVERAIEHAKRATELDDSDAESFHLLGEAHDAAGDLGGARSAFRAAVALRPGDLALRAHLARIEAEYERENLPEEYALIHESERLTRAQLAALIFFELRSAFDEIGNEANVIATDISTSWAYEPIRRVLGAEILEVFPNHTFQPEAFVDRIYFSRALSAAVRKLTPDVYEAAKRSPRIGQKFSDLSGSNVNYESAALVISLGLLIPGEDGGFEPFGLVSGADAVIAMEMLSAHMSSGTVSRS